MISRIVVRLCCALSAVALVSSTSCPVEAGVSLSVDRIGYAGNWTRYGSLSDAQNGTNAVGSGLIGQRDLTVYVTRGVPNIYPDANIIMTNWAPSSTSPGAGNPSNQNAGFIQMYDIDGSTETSIEAYWADSSLSSYYFRIAGENALPQLSSTITQDYARFGEIGAGPGSTTSGTYHQYELEMLLSGMTGAYNELTGLFEASGFPTGVVGTFTAIFENLGSDPSRHGYYAINADLNMNNWAYDQGLLTPGDSSYVSSAAVPEPGSLAIWGLAGLGAIVARRRRQKTAAIQVA